MATITPKEGEEVLLTLRKSFLSLRKQILILLLLLVSAALLLILVNNEYTTLLALVLLFVGALYAFYNFIIWFYDVYIITNRRIVIVSQKSMFTREVIETEATKIMDVRYKISGVLATIFQYGTLTMHTGSGQDIELTDLPDPGEVQDIVKALAAASRKHENLTNIGSELSSL